MIVTAGRLDMTTALRRKGEGNFRQCSKTKPPGPRPQGLNRHCAELVMAYGAAASEEVLRLSEKIPDRSEAICACEYPIKLKAVVVGKCDRTEGMISGPLFTSNEFPWPEKMGGTGSQLLSFTSKMLANWLEKILGKVLSSFGLCPVLTII